MQEQQFHSLVSFFPPGHFLLQFTWLLQSYMWIQTCVAAPVHNGFLSAEFCQILFCSSPLRCCNMACVCACSNPQWGFFLLLFSSFFLSFYRSLPGHFPVTMVKVHFFLFFVVPSEGPDMETTCAHTENKGRWEKVMLPEPGF